MLTVNKHLETILEHFYLDEDDNTVRRKQDGYYGRYSKGDAVVSFKLCKHGYGGVHIPSTRTTVPLHHLVLALRGVEISDDLVVDHLNGNTLDNSRENLRLTTQSINCRNARMKRSNTSGVTGINWNAASNSFVVRKQINGQRIYLGQAATLDEAKNLLQNSTAILATEGYTERHGKYGATTIP